MSASCGSHGCSHTPPAHRSARYRRVLWLALIINAAMFVVEAVGGWRADSVSLLADAVDFFGDAANYGVSLLVLGMALQWRARAALLKGLSMGVFGVFVLGRAIWSASSGAMPEPVTMGTIGSLALVANVVVALMLYAWREGDANMRSVWLCSRNDAIGNLAVMVAAFGVFGTGSAWPDLVVASVMALLEHVHAEAAGAGHRDRHVHLQFAFELGDLRLAHQRIGDLFRHPRRQRRAAQRQQLALDLDVHRRARTQEHVRGVLFRHQLEEVADIHRVDSRSLPAICACAAGFPQ